VVEIAFGAAFDTCHQSIRPDVELAFVYKQGVVNVLLDNTSSPFATGSLFYQTGDFTDVLCN